MSNGSSDMIQPAERSLTNSNPPASRVNESAFLRTRKPMEASAPLDDTNSSTAPLPSNCAGAANIHNCFPLVAGIAPVFQALGFQ